MFVDSHCHLNFPQYADQLDAIRADMAAHRVDRALCISTTLEEFPAVHALATRYDNLWATVGVHPDNEGVQEPTLDDLLTRAALPRVVGIGETGLDYYRLGERTVADMAWQRDRFRVHIEAALQTDLPLVIHTRNASDDTVSILRGAGQGKARGVFHCFTETEAVARAALDMGFLISFSGILTFKNAADLRFIRGAAARRHQGPAGRRNWGHHQPQFRGFVLACESSLRVSPHRCRHPCQRISDRRFGCTVTIRLRP
jgi:TatD DNase family protein